MREVFHTFGLVTAVAMWAGSARTIKNDEGFFLWLVVILAVSFALAVRLERKGRG